MSSSSSSIAPLMLLAAALIAPSQPLCAQRADSARVESSASSSSSSGAAAHAPARTSAIGVGLLLATTTAVLMPYDRPITRALRSEARRESPAWRRTMGAFDKIGAPGAQMVGPLLLVGGRLGGRPRVMDAGLHAIEAYAGAASVTFVAKGLAGRARPYSVTWSRPDDFVLGRGWPHREPYSSMPTGHATGVFAMAAALTAETGHWQPRRQRLVGTLLFGAATLDGVSRVYRDTHWPSDVAASAAVGTTMGLLVVRRQHAHPHNRLDRVARRLTLVPDEGGWRVGVDAAF